MGPEMILMVILASTAGAAIGTFTGLVPGIHVNTAATLLLGAYPVMNEAISAYADPSCTPVLISCCIMSASAAHSFVDFVPSVFIGVPDADDIVSVLPGHRLLLQGKGMCAVRAAAVGSVIGSLSALALAVPLQWIMLNGGNGYIDYFTLGIILVTLSIIVLTSGNIPVTVFLIAVSGFMGCAIDACPIPVIGIIGGGTLLFPLLTGLFGLPPLLEKTSGKKHISQTDDGTDPVGPVPGFRGVATGLIAGWFPGITSTAGALLASAVTKENNPARFVSMTASIGTVTSVFSVVTLAVSGSGRSGTSMVVKEIIGDRLDGFCSEAFLLILFSIALASLLGYCITIQAGKLMANVSEKVPEALLNNCILVLIAVLVFLFTGPFGLALLLISSAVGMIPPSAGVSRVCLTGCLMVPVLLA